MVLFNTTSAFFFASLLRYKLLNFYDPQFPYDIVATVRLKKVVIFQICTCIIGCFLFQTSTPTAPAPESASDRLHKVQQALKSNLMSTPSSEKSTINYNERRYEVRLVRQPQKGAHGQIRVFSNI